MTVACHCLSLLSLSLLMNFSTCMAEMPWKIGIFYSGLIAFLLPVFFICKPPPRGYGFFLLFKASIFIDSLLERAFPVRDGLSSPLFPPYFLERLHAIGPDVSTEIRTGWSDGVTEAMLEARGKREMVMKPMIAGELAIIGIQCTDPWWSTGEKWLGY